MLSSIMFHLFIFPSAVNKGPYQGPALLVFVIVFLMIAILTRMRQNFNVDLICISVITENIVGFFSFCMLIGHLYFLSEELSVSSAHLLIGCFLWQGFEVFFFFFNRCQIIILCWMYLFPILQVGYFFPGHFLSSNPLDCFFI